MSSRISHTAKENKTTYQFFVRVFTKAYADTCTSKKGFYEFSTQRCCYIPLVSWFIQQFSLINNDETKYHFPYYAKRIVNTFGKVSSWNKRVTIFEELCKELAHRLIPYTGVNTLIHLTPETDEHEIPDVMDVYHTINMMGDVFMIQNITPYMYALRMRDDVDSMFIAEKINQKHLCVTDTSVFTIESLAFRSIKSKYQLSIKFDWGTRKEYSSVKFNDHQEYPLVDVLDGARQMREME